MDNVNKILYRTNIQLEKQPKNILLNPTGNISIHKHINVNQFF